MNKLGDFVRRRALSKDGKMCKDVQVKDLNKVQRGKK